MLLSARLRDAGLFMLVAAHALSAGYFGWRAPHGFAPFSLLFFSNEGLPALVALGGVASIIVAIIRPAAIASAGLGLAGVWLGAAVTSFALFPSSAWRLALIAAASGGAMGLFSWRVVGALRPAVALGLVAGALGAGAQRAPEPATHPLGGTLGAKEAGSLVTLECGGLSLKIEPVLRFESCSDDRFWALWADRHCPAPSDFATQLRREGEVTVIEAQTRLAAPVFSHLNSFTTVSISRAGLRAAVAGGPAEPFSPETGPRRFAWLGGDGELHTSRSTRDEKGPFIELALAHLERQALVVVLSDDAGPACRVSFETWAAQASVEASPTAGWGVAQNGLELLEASDGSVAGLVLSLAATSIGRGWDTVGHAAGTYRNLVRFEPLR